MNYVVDDIGAVVERMKANKKVLAIAADKGIPNMPFYLYGHRVEIARRLTAKRRNVAKEQERYPLVALRMDIVEEHTDKMIHYTLNIAILAFTKEQYNAEDRMVNVFKPVLYPLYQAFLDELRKSGLFLWENFGMEPPHEKIDRPYWGIESGEGNIKKIFDDPLDAIEIQNLKISQTLKC